MGNSKKKHSVTHFLIGSFIGLIVFSIMVFSMLGIYMSRKSNKSINFRWSMMVAYYKAYSINIFVIAYLF